VDLTQEPGVALMELNDTCRSSVLPEDKCFHQQVTQMCLGTSISLNTLNIIRVPLEEMPQKLLGATPMLVSDYVAGIIEEEINTQIEELNGHTAVSICFDATPIMGDVFALIIRYVSTTDERMSTMHSMALMMNIIYCTNPVASYHQQAKFPLSID
jgi:hypothetical protein